MTVPKFDYRPRLHVELAPMAHNSHVYVVPGPDDWMGVTTEISRFVSEANLYAKVGDATKSDLHLIAVEGDALTVDRVTSTPKRRRWRR